MTQLYNTGLYVTHARELYEEAEFAQVYDHVHKWLESKTVEDECRKFAEGIRQADLKPFVIKYREEKVRVYKKDDPLLNLHNPKVQAIVEQAIGPAKLICLDLWHNPPNCAKHAPKWSQSWHRDPEDSQPVKVFILLSDVSVHAGPFEYVLCSPWCFYDLCPPGLYPTEPIDETKVPWQLVYKLTGVPGVVGFANTSGLHKGGHGKESRTMAVLTYVPEQSPAGVLFKIQ